MWCGNCMQMPAWWHCERLQISSMASCQWLGQPVAGSAGAWRCTPTHMQHCALVALATQAGKATTDHTILLPA